MARQGLISVTFKLDADGKGFKAIAQDANGLRQVMTATLEQAEALKTSLVNWSAAVRGLQSFDSALGQISSRLNSLTAESGEFNKAMKEANTMAGKDSEGFKRLKGEVADLAKEIPIARDQLASGLYQTISNGVPEDNWIEFLNASARSAVGGLADINNVVGVTSTLIKNYGLEWSAAADIQDKIQLTAKNGVTSFEQLAQALPRVTGNAATLCVSIDELMGTFATLTGVSGNTAEVSTQLAAIFTSLVKPSSEAAEMAAAMGIQFDAAAIKAAGGFQKFLTQLDSSVKSYAQANGVLEQEIYGRLFGSAEAIRALIPLQGELADKFTSNVANMVNSAGTMDAAYADMSSHGEAVNQMLRNQWAAVIDVISGFTAAAQPYINFASGLLSTGSSVAILVTTFKQFNIQQTLVATRARLARVAVERLGPICKSTAAVMRVFSSAVKGGAQSVTALKTALRGLLSLTGIVAVVVAMIDVFMHLSSAMSETSVSAGKLRDAEERAKQEAEQLERLRQQEASTLATTRAALEMNIAKLKEFNGTKEQEMQLVSEMNNTYGETMGYFSSVADWYNALISNSEAYCRQMIVESRIRMLANRIAEKEQETHNILYDDTGKAKLYSTKNDTETVTDGTTYDIHGNRVTNYKTVEVPGSSAWDEANADIKANNAVVAHLRQQMRDAVKEAAGIDFKVKGRAANPASGVNTGSKISEMNLAQTKASIKAIDEALESTTDSLKIKELKARKAKLEARKKTLESETGLGTKKRTSKKKVAVADPKTVEELNTNIEIYEKKLTGEDTAEQRALIEKIALWKKAKESIERVQEEAERPTSLTTLEDIDKELNYQRALRQRATKENIAGIDAEIERLEELRDQLDSSGFVPTPVADIKTYRQLNKEISNLTALLERADETQRATIQKALNDCNKLKKAWDDALEDLNKPGDISELGTLAELGEALSYYQRKQENATGDEIQNNQRVIDALQRKREALLRGTEIPSMLHEAAEINKLTGREYKVKIRGMGFDELTEKIDALNRMLNDTENPVTASQREDIESLIATYERWRKEGVSAFGTIRDGWEGAKDIGSGIESLTDALEGNGNAWKTITGIVDGFLQIYDSIKTIIGIMEMIGIISKTNATAKTAEATATGAASAAQASEAVTAGATAAAQAAVITANKAATASYMELAAAAFYAAHASMPIFGFGIATGFVTAATGIVQGIGMTTFADGGIVSGPTVGLIGEYAGASNNPEVVAPLDKLRGMLNPAGEPVVIGGTLRASGRELICVLANETRIASKSGRRTNIKL